MEKLQFSKLNGNNYQMWKFKMELFLIEKDLWDTISQERPDDPSDEWLKRDGKARARIGLMVEDNQLCHIRKATSAAGVWTALKTHHEKSTLTNKIFLLKRLCRMQMPTNGNMEEHVNNMLDLVNQLEVLGEKLGDHLVVALLLCSLPDDYNTLITALESRDEKDLTLEMVKGKLVNEYKRNIESEANSFSSSAPNDKESAMKVGKTYFKGLCNFCKKKGHIQRDCYSFKRSQNNRKVDSKNDSKLEPEKAKKTLVASNEYESETEVKYKCFMMVKPKKPKSDWYIDSGTTSHMNNDLKFFREIKMGKKHPVELPDGRIIFSSGTGEGFFGMYQRRWSSTTNFDKKCSVRPGSGYKFTFSEKVNETWFQSKF